MIHHQPLILGAKSVGAGGDGMGQVLVRSFEDMLVVKQIIYERLGFDSIAMIIQ